MSIAISLGIKSENNFTLLNSTPDNFFFYHIFCRWGIFIYKYNTNKLKIENFIFKNVKSVEKSGGFILIFIIIICKLINPTFKIFK